MLQKHKTIFTLAEYINAILHGKDDNHTIDEETDGVSLTTGYAIQITPNFYNELGFDYLILNKAVGISYLKETRLENMNSVFAFQTKPTYRPSIDADDKVFLTIGMAVNYQKIYSKGNFSDYKNSTFAAGQKQSN